MNYKTPMKKLLTDIDHRNNDRKSRTFTGAPQTIAAPFSISNIRANAQSADRNLLRKSEHR